MKIEVLYFEGCPNHAPATELVREVLQKEGKCADIQEVEVRTPEQAQSLGFWDLRASASMAWMWNLKPA